MTTFKNTAFFVTNLQYQYIKKIDNYNLRTVWTPIYPSKVWVHQISKSFHPNVYGLY